MTTAADEPVPPSPVKRPASRRRLVLVLLLFGVALGSGVGWYVWHWRSQLEPPAVDLAGADPEVAAAVTSARDAVRRSPRSAAGWGKLGKVLAAHRFEEPADACFAEAERLEPTDGRWPYFRGLTLLFHDSDAAIGRFQRAVQLRANAPAMRLRLAEALQAQGRLDESEDHFRRLLDAEGFAARAQLGLARMAYGRGDMPGARTQLARCEDDPLTRRAAHSLLAEIELRCHDSAAASRERARAAELPEDSDWFDPFLDEIDQLKVGKDARLAYALRLLHQERGAEAEALFRELVSSYPDWPQVWLTYGHVLLDHRADAPAEEALREAVQLEPGSVGGHFDLGLALVRRGEYREAATHFRETNRLKPDHAMAYYNLGHCLKRLNDRPGALTAFREAVRCQPGLGAAHTNLGESLADLGNKAAAIEELRLGLELNPDDATAKKLLERLSPEK